MSEQRLPVWQRERQSERQRFAASNCVGALASSDVFDGLVGMPCAFGIAGENFSDGRSGLSGGGNSLGAEVIRWKSSRTR